MIAHDVPVARPITRGLARAAGGVLAGKGRTAGAIALAALLFGAGGAAQAQSREQAARGVAPACFIRAQAAEAVEADRQSAAARPNVVLASCSGSGLVLGEADRFRYFHNPATGAVVVHIERLGRMRVLLLQRDAEGLSVEDITGDLSLIAGRGPTDGLRGVTPDYAAFASEGVIGLAAVRSAVEADAGEGAALRTGAASAAFSLADHNARRAAAAAARVAGGAQ